MPEEDNYIPDNISDYFKIISLEDNSNISYQDLDYKSPYLMYSLNETTWKRWNYSTINLNKGDILYFKGTNNSVSWGSSHFSITGKVELGGNIMSLLYKDDFENNNTLPGTRTFYRLFYNCTGIVSAKDLILPATTLASSCYDGMFSGCTSLTTSPELPATTLANYCYNGMFYGCTSLTTAPQLPATTLAYSCYSYMFNGCKSLTTAPELPATTLASYCYDGMFYNSTSLTTPPQLPATTLNYSCYSGMFSGCTSLTTSPELPATTLANYCYNGMFYGCSKLNHITMIATNISATGCLTSWVYGVASSGTFVKNSAMTTLQSGISGIPSGWTVEDYVE